MESSRNIYNNEVFFNNEDLKKNYHNDKLDNRTKLRKKAINKILMKKTCFFLRK